MKGLAGQVILAALEGTEATANELVALREFSFAGITLFTRNISTPYVNTRNLIQSIQAIRGENPPLLIAIDQEGGRVNRIKQDFPNEGPALNLAEGRSDDTALAQIESYAYTVGTNLISLGVNLNFAPVCDVWTEPTNIAIGDRAFAKSPKDVALRAGAFAAGLTRAGVLNCLKHFPGQGDAKADTHLASCRIELHKQDLDRRELLPFRKLVSTANMVMLSHCIYTGIDAEKPASLSTKVIQGTLKGALSFDGLVVSDDMVMHAIPQDESSWVGAIIECISAGVDLVLVCRHMEKAVLAADAIEREAARCSRFRTRLEDAAHRVTKLRLTL